MVREEHSMPQNGTIVEQAEATPEERRSLFSARLQCLETATSLVNEGEPLPAKDRHGWTAYINIHGRDRDGSLLATITVRDREKSVRLTRNLRLVPQEKLDLKHS